MIKLVNFKKFRIFLFWSGLDQVKCQGCLLSCDLVDSIHSVSSFLLLA